MGNSNDSKPKIMVFVYNTRQVGGPTVAMRLLMSSSLKERYEFREIEFSGRLGNRIRLKLINNIRKEIKAYDPDIVHITGLQLQGFYAALATRLAGKKNILMVVRGSSTDMIEFSAIKKFILGSIVEASTLRMSKVVYTVCKEMAEKQLIKKNSKIFGGVVHNAVPIIDHSQYNKKAFKEELGLNEEDILVVYTGRVTKEKGLHFALDAFGNIKDERVKFVICGSGEDTEELVTTYKPLIDSNKVFFLGSRKDVINVLIGCDIFLFPTLHENLSNSLLEACAVGMPVIATDVGGNPEVIQDGVNGLLVEASDAKAIQLAIETLIEDPEKMRRYGATNKEKVCKDFSQEKIFGQVDLLYKGILNNTIQPVSLSDL